MQFDVVVGNPPYNPPVKSGPGCGGRTNLWRRFVEAAIERMVVPGGHLCFIHPPTWRAPRSHLKRSRVEDLWELMTQRHHMMSLKIYTKSPFPGVGTKADHYVIRILREDEKPGHTLVTDCDRLEHVLDLGEWEFLPNGRFDAVKELLAAKDDERLDIHYSSTLNDIRRAHMSRTQDEKFRHPVLATTLKGGSVWHWSSEVSGAGPKPKLMFSLSSLNDIVLDAGGGLGYGTGVISVLNSEIVSDHDRFKAFMLGDFRRLAPYIQWGIFHLSPCFFTKLRKDFYR